MPTTDDAPCQAACPRCGGTGSVDVTGVYAETLALLRAQPGEASGADLARQAGCAGPAMNNRLAALENMGLAASRRYGRLRLFRAARAKEVEGN